MCKCLVWRNGVSESGVVCGPNTIQVLMADNGLKSYATYPVSPFLMFKFLEASGFFVFCSLDFDSFLLLLCVRE